jgi:hypothetical protein
MEILRQNTPPDERHVDVAEQTFESRRNRLRNLNLLAPILVDELQILPENAALLCSL